MTERHLILGGNAAGMTAASRAKRLDPSLAITIVEATRHISYSICGLPYRLGGRVSRFEDLVYFTPERLLNERGIEARVETRAVEILAGRRAVVVESARTGKQETLSYDKLLIATGYRPRSPNIDGIDAQGVFTASRIEDGEAIENWLASRQPARAVLVGGGYVALEMAEALHARGLSVTILEAADHLFPALDADVARVLESKLEASGVRVMTGRTAARVHPRRDGSVESVELTPGTQRIPADIVFVDVGVEPRVDLAVRAGVGLGASGAIAVSERMETNIPAIYAAGNCSETLHRVSGRFVLDPLGTVAAKQGRVAGENMAGRVARFEGACGTAVVQIFGLAAARTGLSSAEAAEAGFRMDSVTIRAPSQARYFGETGPATVKVVADADSHRLLGAQIAGSPLAAVRIDAVAAALSAGMTVEEVAQLDLAYAPPVGALWNPVLVATHALLRQWDRGR